MKSLLLVVLLALPMHAQIRGGLRVGGYQGLITGTAELEARRGNWSIAPALEVTRGGYDLHAWHVDVRRLFIFDRQLLLGAVHRRALLHVRHAGPPRRHPGRGAAVSIGISRRLR